MTGQIFLYAFSVHRSFISFIIQELKTCILLKTSLKVISLSKVTVFSVRITCFTKNIYSKSVDTESTNVKVAKSADVEDF